MYSFFQQTLGIVGLPLLGNYHSRLARVVVAADFLLLLPLLLACPFQLDPSNIEKTFAAAVAAPAAIATLSQSVKSFRGGFSVGGDRCLKTGR